MTTTRLRRLLRPSLFLGICLALSVVFYQGGKVLGGCSQLGCAGVSGFGQTLVKGQCPACAIWCADKNCLTKVQSCLMCGSLNTKGMYCQNTSNTMKCCPGVQNGIWQLNCDAMLNGKCNCTLQCVNNGANATDNQDATCQAVNGPAQATQYTCKTPTSAGNCP